MFFIACFLFTSVYILLLTFFVTVVGILKIKYYKCDNSILVHVINYTIWIVTASPLASVLVVCWVFKFIYFNFLMIVLLYFFSNR